MATSAPSPIHEKRHHHALETLLSSWEAAEDLLSGSEFSSPATSPVEEEPLFKDYFRRPTEATEAATSNRKESPAHSDRPVDSIDLVKSLLARLSQGEAADEFLTEHVKIECCSEVILDQKEETRADSSYTHVHRDLIELRRTCASYELKVDDVFGIGDSVAAFGHFAYADCPMGKARNVKFSVWAKVDVEAPQISFLRWTDHLVRADEHGKGDLSHLDK